MSEQLTEQIISTIKEKLGIEIDKFSYDYDIIDIIANFNSKYNNVVEEFINSFTFEKLNSNNLDKFVNYFDIYRTKGNNEDLYIFKLKYITTKKDSINILKGCTVQFEEDYYKVLKDTVVSSNDDTLTVQKIFNDKYIEEPIYSNKGTLILDKKFVKTSNEDVPIESDLSKNLHIISFQREVNEQENDFELLEKSKNVMQSYGYSNDKKIELLLLEDDRIKNVEIKDSNSATNIIIFPKKLEQLDEIIKYNQYVVDYYKTSNIVLLKPNIFEVNISGLMSQLNLLGDFDSMRETIINDLKVTLSLLYSETDTLTLKKEDIISSLKTTINKFYLKTDIDYKYVNISYNYYFRNNYNTPIMNDVIYGFETIKKSDVITLGTVE